MAIKVELSEKEQKLVSQKIKSNPIYNFLKDRDLYDFNLGDVLVRLNSRYNGHNVPVTWEPETISYENKMAQRYVVVHKDDMGLCYAKQLMVSTGKLGQEVFSISEYDVSGVRFQVDPEYAEAEFLGGDFDIKKLHKQSLEARKIITKMNRKTGKKLPTLKDRNLFFKSLKPGARFWTSSDYTCKYLSEYEFISFVEVTPASLVRDGDYSWNGFSRRNTEKPSLGLLNDTTVVKVTYKDIGNRHSSGNREQLSISFYHDYVFYSVEPAQEEKKK